MVEQMKREAAERAANDIYRHHWIRQAKYDGVNVYEGLERVKPEGWSLANYVYQQAHLRLEYAIADIMLMYSGSVNEEMVKDAHGYLMEHIAAEMIPEINDIEEL
jgi:hypothetical protein